jgi:hypothetical protein
VLVAACMQDGAMPKIPGLGIDGAMYHVSLCHSSIRLMTTHILSQWTTLLRDSWCHQVALAAAG